MDTQQAFDSVKALIAQVQADPAALRGDLVKARDAFATVAQLLTHLQAGQIGAAQAIVTGMEDVDRARQASLDMAALNAKDGAIQDVENAVLGALSSAGAILERVGPLVPIALSIAAAVA